MGLREFVHKECQENTLVEEELSAVQFKLYGSRATLDMLTSIGFSTNTLYKQTTVTLTNNGVPSIDILPIEDRKEPFRKMLTELVSNIKIDLADVSSALHVMQDIFASYNYSSLIRGRL